MREMKLERCAQIEKQNKGEGEEERMTEKDLAK